MCSPRKSSALVMALPLWLSCAESPDVAVAAAPTFVRDVAPIVYRHCASCHRPGQSAPFALLEHRDVAKRSRQIVEVVRSGFMPPWLPEEGAHALADARRLTEAEIETLARWHADGTPEGAGSVEPPSFPSGWTLGEPNLVLEVPQAYPLGAEGDDEFRNLIVPVELPSTVFVRAFEFRPVSPAVVHHAIVAVDRDGECRRLATEDALPGFPGMGMGTARPPDGHFLGWTPGRLPYQVPADMAWRLAPGDDLVLQLHMTKSGKPEEVRPRLGLYLTDTPPTRFPHSVVLYSESIDIPAGAAQHAVRDEFTLPVEVDVLGVYPHAHYLGKRLVGWAERPDGEREELLRIEDWDFNWQEEYRYAEPVRLPAGTVLHMEWVYDNTADNPRNPNQPPRRVGFGERSVDEMGTLSFMVLPRDPDGLARLQMARWTRTIEKKPYDWAAFNALGALWAEEGQRAQAMECFRAALRLRPDYADARSNLGLALLNDGQPQAALQELQRALASEPGHRGASTYLGRALASMGRTGEALTHLRGVLQRRPDVSEARLMLGDLLALSGQPRAALVEYRTLLRDRPDLPEANNNLANTLFTLEDLDGAVQHYERALAARPDYFNARFNLGRALLAAGRRAEGIECLREAARLRPEDRLVGDELARALAGG